MELHTEKREYALPAGVMDSETMSNIYGYLEDIQRGFDMAPPTFEEFKREVYPDDDLMRLFISDGYDIDIRHRVCAYVGFRGANYHDRFHYSPDAYIPGGSHPEQRQKNVESHAKQWYRFVTDRTPSFTDGFVRIFPNELEMLGCDWIVAGKGDYVGTYPKRLSKLILKKYGLKLRSCHIETIGNIGSAALGRSDSYVLSFDRNYLNGSDLDYVNSGSCWWGCHGGARQMLYDEGGYAIRAWEGNRPIARCWIIPNCEDFVLFNAYGRLTLFEFARLLSHHFGWSYRKTVFKNYGSGSGELYINDSKGIILAPSDHIECYGESPYVDLRLDEQHIDSCAECGTEIDSDDSYRAPEGDLLCCDCFGDRFTTCERCTDPIDNDDIINCDGDYYCESCADGQGFEQCSDCGEWRTDCQKADDDKIVCESCADGYAVCAYCDLLTSANYRDIDDDAVCASCVDDLCECEDCGKLDRELTECQEGNLCSHCLDDCETCLHCLIPTNAPESLPGGYVCRDCIPDHYRVCDCGEYVPRDPTLFPLCACPVTVS